MREFPEPPSAPDPEQLPLGMFEGVPIVPIETIGPDDTVVVVPVREPPVCGEWSYEDSELEEPRFVARRVDGIAAPTSKATPVFPIRAVVEARSAAATRATSRAAPPPRQSPAPSTLRAQPALSNRAMRPSIDALRLAFEQSQGDTARVLAYVAALEKQGDAKTALAVLDAAEAAGGDPLALTCARASALGALLRYDDAERMIRKAAKLRFDAAEVLLQTGILACRRGRWRDAIEPLQRAAVLSPESAITHYFIGEALNHADDLAGARAAYERAAELEPDHWRALKGVGIVLDRLGRPAEAAVFYRRARDAQRA